jgi:hypothetical protein
VDGLQSWANLDILDLSDLILSSLLEKTLLKYGTHLQVHIWIKLLGLDSRMQLKFLLASSSVFD